MVIDLVNTLRGSHRTLASSATDRSGDLVYWRALAHTYLLEEPFRFGLGIATVHASNGKF